MLRRLLIRPVYETEVTEDLKLLTETLNLTKAAMMKGIMSTNEDLDLRLENNSFYKAFGNYSCV